LIGAIRERRSLVIFGPPDSGKSALVDRALAKLPLGIASNCLHVRVERPFQRVLQRHVIGLVAAKDFVAQTAFLADAGEFRSAESWVKKQTSGRLRSLLFRAFDRSRYWIFWDGGRALGLSHYHFLREVIWMRKTPVYVLARGLGYEYLGQAGRLFWSDEQRLALGPLPPEQARDLLEFAIENKGLEGLDLDGFREQVLEASRGLPGAILKMAAMAGQPQYQFGNKVKTTLIHTDYLIQLASRVQI
jgi:hypothetical protein